MLPLDYAYRHFQPPHPCYFALYKVKQLNISLVCLAALSGCLTVLTGGIHCKNFLEICFLGNLSQMWMYHPSLFILPE